MFEPEDPLKPLRPHFQEDWHAQVLALADSLVTNGTISAVDWAEALGTALKSVE